jgi:hypothetical protein
MGARGSVVVKALGYKPEGVFQGSEVQLVCEADNPTTIYELIV